MMPRFRRRNIMSSMHIDIMTCRRPVMRYPTSPRRLCAWTEHESTPWYCAKSCDSSGSCATRGPVALLLALSRPDHHASGSGTPCVSSSIVRNASISAGGVVDSSCWAMEAIQRCFFRACSAPPHLRLTWVLAALELAPLEEASSRLPLTALDLARLYDALRCSAASSSQARPSSSSVSSTPFWLTSKTAARRSMRPAIRPISPPLSLFRMLERSACRPGSSAETAFSTRWLSMSESISGTNSMPSLM
mmetsp:Transcript_4701/g.11765  ORF Transcript_4701/g.11765 Transcript_4701/m.11765 type:complete len:248 (+) Transcript_4701:169-912(+)